MRVTARLFLTTKLAEIGPDMLRRTFKDSTQVQLLLYRLDVEPIRIQPVVKGRKMRLQQRMDEKLVLR
jgi:hypothetical protein